jgi:hypothetical protein
VERQQQLSFKIRYHSIEWKLTDEAQKSTQEKGIRPHELRDLLVAIIKGPTILIRQERRYSSQLF